MPIILKTFLENCGMGTILHIATEHGSKWCFTGLPLQVSRALPASWGNREVVAFYYHEGREEVPSYCCKLEPGIAVIVEGYENGQI